jgi:ABC-type multidrug transport system fused ATPase/permease subunit
MQRDDVEVEEGSSSQALPASSSLRITWHNIEYYVADKSLKKKSKPGEKEGEGKKGIENEMHVVDEDGEPVSIAIDDDDDEKTNTPNGAPPEMEGDGEGEGEGDEASKPLYRRLFSSGSSKRKRVLHSVSGSVGPGEILCIMGPSGAGKSTLMNIICGRKKPSKGGVSLLRDPWISCCCCPLLPSSSHSPFLFSRPREWRPLVFISVETKSCLCPTRRYRAIRYCYVFVMS